MTRRAITRADEAMVQVLLSKAFDAAGIRTVRGGPPGLHYNNEGQLFAIDGRRWDGVGAEWQRMGAAAASVGIHPGASGWEIDDAAPPARPPLPDGWAWNDGVYLTREDGGGREIAEAKMDEATIYASESSLEIAARIPARDTAHAREIAERVCWDRGLFGVDAKPNHPREIRGLVIGPKEPSPARPPLPLGFGWFERGVDSYSLDGPDGKPIARVRPSTTGVGSTWAIGDDPATWAVNEERAKGYAEDFARSRGLFDEPEELLYVRVARVLGVEAHRVTLTTDVGSDVIQGATIDGLPVDGAGLRAIGAAGFKVRPKVEADPAFPSDGGVEREASTGAAQAFSRALLFVAGFDETGFPRQSAGSATEYLAYLDGLAKTFVRELRREVAPAEKPRGTEDAAGAFVGSRVERTTDAALTSYLAEHYPNERRPGEDALALAIRLLGTQREAIDMVGESLRAANARATYAESERDEAREEARVADENAAELAADLKRIRDEVLEAARDLAARMGAPHG